MDGHRSGDHFWEAAFHLPPSIGGASGAWFVLGAFRFTDRDYPIPSSDCKQEDIHLPQSSGQEPVQTQRNQDNEGNFRSRKKEQQDEEDRKEGLKESRKGPWERDTVEPRRASQSLGFCLAEEGRPLLWIPS